MTSWGPDLVASVMEQQPSRDASKVFWIVDGGTIHRGPRAVERPQSQWKNLVLVHLPTHASWLNQIGFCFSILQRKALTPDDLRSRDAVTEHILGFQRHYRPVAIPFDWKFTRQDLVQLLARCDHAHSLGVAA